MSQVSDHLIEDEYRGVQCLTQAELRRHLGTRRYLISIEQTQLLQSKLQRQRQHLQIQREALLEVRKRLLRQEQKMLQSFLQLACELSTDLEIPAIRDTVCLAKGTES